MPQHRPPGHLKAATKRWFQEVIAEYELMPHHVKLLTLAGEAWDRCTEARVMLKKEGIVIVDRFGQQKPHPAIAIERDNRLAFARLVRELGLDFNEPDETRPPRLGGVN